MEMTIVTLVVGFTLRLFVPALGMLMLGSWLEGRKRRI